MNKDKVPTLEQIKRNARRESKLGELTLSQCLEKQARGLGYNTYAALRHEMGTDWCEKGSK